MEKTKKVAKIVYKHGDMYKGDITKLAPIYNTARTLRQAGASENDLFVIVGDTESSHFPKGAVVRCVRDDNTASPYFGYYDHLDASRDNDKYNSIGLTRVAILPKGDGVLLQGKTTDFSISYTAKDGTVYRKNTITILNPGCSGMVEETIERLVEFRKKHLKSAKEIALLLSTHAKLFKISKPRKRVKKKIKLNPKKK